MAGKNGYYVEEALYVRPGIARGVTNPFLLDWVNFTHPPVSLYPFYSDYFAVQAIDGYAWYALALALGEKIFFRVFLDTAVRTGRGYPALTPENCKRNGKYSLGFARAIGTENAYIDDVILAAVRGGFWQV